MLKGKPETNSRNTRITETKMNDPIPAGVPAFPGGAHHRTAVSLCLLLCILLLPLSGCEKEEEKKPGTIALFVSGDYDKDFTRGGWATATITAVFVDAEGRSTPITGEYVSWSAYECRIDEHMAAWNRRTEEPLSRSARVGLNWGRTPLPPQGPSGDPQGVSPHGDTACLTDIVGSRTVTVAATLYMETPEGKSQELRGEVTFTFGDGPLSLFSSLPRRVSSRAEAEQMCAALPDSELPAESLLRLVANDGKEGHGAARAAGWPGDIPSLDLYNYWAAETNDNGRQARVVNVEDGQGLWYFPGADGPFAVCARKGTATPPAPAPSPAPASLPDRAALRAEAEEMLLPHRPNDLIPVPDVWKLHCGSHTPLEYEAPSYYGTPLPAPGLDGCYREERIFDEPPVFSLEEAARFDPSTIPNRIILEPEFALPKVGLDIRDVESKLGLESPLRDLVRKARKGNPLAALRLSLYFDLPTRASFDNRSRFFWLRVADALTRPGWGDAMYSGVKEEVGALLGEPLEMLDFGGDFLGGIPEGREPFMAWLRECTLRGRSFVWSAWFYMYAFNTIDAARPGGLFDKPDPTKGYAMALAGSRMPLFLWDNRVYAPECALLAARLEQGAPGNGLDVERGKALAEELYAVYQENLQRVLAEQRRNRAEALPEINRQIDQWLKEAEREQPKWLKAM